jgi:hypothetical protein
MDMPAGTKTPTVYAGGQGGVKLEQTTKNCPAAAQTIKLLLYGTIFASLRGNPGRLPRPVAQRAYGDSGSSVRVPAPAAGTGAGRRAGGLVALVPLQIDGMLPIY